MKTLRFEGFGDFGTDKVNRFIRAKLTAVVAIRNSSLLSLSLCYGGGVSERSYCFDGGVGKIGPEIRSFREPEDCTRLYVQAAKSRTNAHERTAFFGAFLKNSNLPTNFLVCPNLLPEGFFFFVTN